MNASYVAEYRELQTRAAQLEEALAAATAAAADYERLETRSVQLEDALAAQLAYSLSAAATRLTPQELQAERAAHKEASDECVRLRFRSLQLEGELSASRKLLGKAREEMNALVELWIEDKAQYDAEVVASEYEEEKLKDLLYHAEQQQKDLLFEARQQHCLEIDAAVAELQDEVAEYRSNSARSPRLTSVLEDSPAATNPCDEDCERKLAASEKSRKLLEEQMRGMVSEIAALRELLEETRTQHAHDHAAAAAHAIKFAEELQSRADRAHDTAGLECALAATQERVQQLELLLKTSVSELAASERQCRHAQLSHECATREAAERLDERCPRAALECQRHNASLRQELESSAEDWHCS